MPEDSNDEILRDINRKLNPSVPNATLWKSFNYVCSVLADSSSTTEQELTDNTPDNKPPSEVERMKKQVTQ